MSFVAQFERLDKENKQLFDEFTKKYNELPVQLQNLLTANETKLWTFIENFQNQIIVIKKSQQRDCTLIDNLRYQNSQRRSQSRLLESAIKMEQQLVEKMKGNIKETTSYIKQAELQNQKHWELKNRSQVDAENVSNSINMQASRLRANIGPNSIEIDRNSGKILMKSDQNGGTIFEVAYNRRDDRFTAANNGDNKAFVQIVAEFNFHRDLSKLYSQLLNMA